MKIPPFYEVNLFNRKWQGNGWIWRRKKNSRPLFTISFRPKMLKFHPYSILTGETKVRFVIYCVFLKYLKEPALSYLGESQWLVHLGAYVNEFLVVLVYNSQPQKVWLQHYELLCKFFIMSTESWLQSEMFLSNSVDMMKNLPVYVTIIGKLEVGSLLKNFKVG